jgi:K+-transporting ATPase ATPase A chain
MLGLTVHNVLSAATGIALAMALVRGFSRRSARALGNFWVDLTRSTLYVLLPLSIVVALALVWQGVPQNFDAYTQAVGLEGIKQMIAQGPVASQEAIKMLGTNGGGFFNANSAHPFENPTALSNLIEMWALIVIAAALTYTFGRMVKDTRQGWAIFAVMAVLLVGGLAATYAAEGQGNAAVAASHVAQAGNMEGKEVRFGVAMSSLFATITTAVSCGAVNTMHDSLTPLGGMITIINMELGEIVFGGAGSGLYGMLLFAVIAMFVAGLMVGRTPEYLGKKIEAKEVKMAMLAILILPLSMLGFTALAIVSKLGLAGPLNSGPHGFSEILYAFTSATANNGSAFAGLTANTPFYNITLGLAMLIGRFLMIVPMLAVAGSLASKKIVPPSAGTFPTHGGLFVGLLVGVILIVGGLTFFPVLSLGPIVDHLAMTAGTFF